MTSIDLQTNATATDAAPAETERRKSVLFCPACGHESHVDGNWNVTADESGLQFACPNCGSVVASR